MAESSDARRNAQILRALRDAQRTAGDDDRAFLAAFRAAAPMDLPVRGSRAPAARRSAKGARLDDDPRYLASVRELARQSSGNARIIGGSVVRGTEFHECVAVGDDEDWGCTGTLIAPDVVLTAAHCEALHTRVFVGNDTTTRGRVFRVRRHVRHPRFSSAFRNDLMLLILDKKVTGVRPRPLATGPIIDAAHIGRVVGFGTTNLSGTRGYGVKRRTDVPVVSQACRGRVGGQSDGPVYGCHAGLEIVAGKPLLLRDTCKGDSGGPLLVPDGRNRWLLAGVTSRGTDLAQTMCGDGGLYVRLDKYQDWIQSVVNGA